MVLFSENQFRPTVAAEFSGTGIKSSHIADAMEMYTLICFNHQDGQFFGQEEIQETHENQDTVSTLASRQKKILLEEKENKAARRDINEEKVLEVDDAYANDDKKMVDEIIKGLFAG